MRALTVNEAVALVGVEERIVRKEVEYGVFGTESPPRFKFPALVYLRLLGVGFGLETTVEGRKRIYTLIGDALAHSQVKVELSPVLELKLDQAIREVQSQQESFERWKRERVVTNPHIMGGEPVFANTRLPVRHIGSMVCRHGEKVLPEIREDYPYLSSEDIEFAKLYTVAYPKVGRPRGTKASAR